MNLHRRAFLSATVIAPLAIARRVSALDVEQIEFTPLELENMTALRLSPDGTLLAAVSREGALAVYEVASLKELSRSDATVRPQDIDPLSISWNPAQSHFAFSLNAFLHGTDSDIHIYTVESGELSNATDEGDGDGVGEMATPLAVFGSADIAVDVAPVWLDDATIVFARSTFGDGGLTTRFCSLSVPGFTVGDWAEMEAEVAPAAVMAPIVPMNGDTVVYVASPTSLDYGLNTIQEGGDPTPVGVEGTAVLLVDGNGETGQVCILNYEDGGPFPAILLVDIASAEATDLKDLLNLSNPDSNVLLAANGPEKGQVAAMVDADQMFIIQPDTSGNLNIGKLVGGDSVATSLQWAGNTLLVHGQRTQWLIDVNKALGNQAPVVNGI